MDNNDNRLFDPLNQNGNGFSSDQQPASTGPNSPTPSETDREFEGILSNTVFSDPVFPSAGIPQQVISQQPFQQANLPEPRFGDTFNRDPNFYPPQQQGPIYNQSIPSFNEPPIPERRRRSTMWIALGVIALLLFTSILAIQAAFRSKSASDAPVLPPPKTVSNSAPSPTELSNSFREISKAVKPAVVYIEVTERLDDSQSPEGFGFPAPGGSRRRQSAGSGFIATNDGYIITNNHVVDKASKIEVTLSDNRKYKATVVGTDRETDLAVIKIEETGLPVAGLGNSDDVQQGDWVLALGSPFGLQQTLTAGIVSATGRENPNTQLGRFIQTDASINPGNSGGPLISMNSEVIGINSFILSQPSGFTEQGGNIGIGFAVTSNIAREVFNEIVKKGKVSRGYLGVNPREIDEPLARMYGVAPHVGVLVSNLPGTDTPAAKAGLKVGDIITQFDGKKVTTPRELTDAVTATPVGKSCKIDFIRDGQPQSLNVILAERPSEIAANTTRPENQSPEVNPAATTAQHLGIGVQDITQDLASKKGLAVSSGVIVISVSPGSPAAEAGIRHGDVIYRVDRTVVKSSNDLLQADKALKNGDKISVQVERSGRILFLVVTLE
jgi:serine protease Do